jgi:hypothetical protein
MLQPGAASDDLDWPFKLAELASRHGLNTHVIRRSAADLAWAARSVGQRLPGDAEWARYAESDDPDMVGRVLAYAHGYRLRLDFRFDELADRTREWTSRLPDDALIQSMAAFAALGQRSDRAGPLFERATAAPDYDSSCRSLCLHGLWFATHLPDQAERIIALSNDMIGRGEDTANLYYWRAFALRRNGLLDDALTSIDRAMALLPPGMNAVHQDYAREREHINTTLLLQEQVTILARQLSHDLSDQAERHRREMRAEVEMQSRDARRIVAQSLLGIVEVLALFVTLTGFLIGSGALVLRADNLVEGATALALLAVGAISFFLLLRLVVRFDRRRAGRPPTSPG